MKRRAEIKTKTYEAEQGFMVDIVDTIDDMCGEPIWDVFLYRKGFGVKMYMFGLPKSLTPTIRNAVSIVEGNLPQYYNTYKRDFEWNEEYEY